MSNINQNPQIEESPNDKSFLATILLLVTIAMSVIVFVLILNYKERTSEIETTKSISMENATSFSTGGMTFTIPGNYSQSDSLTISENSTIILGNEALDYLWVSYFVNETILYEKIDELARSMVPDATRLSSETTYVDGVKTFLYSYSGTYEGTQYYAHAATLLNTDNNHVIYAIYVTPYDSGRDIMDFKALLKEARETGDSDSEGSRRVYYVEN